MNGRRAKAARAKIYGDLSPRGRKYARHPNTGVIYADRTRQLYQMEKGRKRHLPVIPAVAEAPVIREVRA